MRWLRRVAWTLGGLAAALLAALLIAYPPAYVWRVLAWGESDVGDRHRFPARAVAAAPGASEPAAAPQTERVRRAFAALHGGDDLDAWLAAQDTLAFVVLQRGRVVYEGYYHGQRRDDAVTSFSVAKSVLSTLVLAAVADGRIASLDDPLTRYVPELQARDARFARITLRQLLQMHSGIAYRELSLPQGDDAKTYYWPDLRALALHETHIAGEPGGAFLYNNYHPLLIGLVVERATGMPVAEYLSKRIWQPAGLGPGASWSLDSEASGFEKLESGVNARALDFARFGQLFLDDGVAADGTRVLPQALVRAATAPDGALPLDALRPGLYYQLFWWGQRRADGGYDFSARGNHGQFVHVSPRNGTVIARFGMRYAQPPGEWMQLFERLADRLGAEP